jgi:hypothetical protein
MSVFDSLPASCTESLRDYFSRTWSKPVCYYSALAFRHYCIKLHIWSRRAQVDCDVCIRLGSHGVPVIRQTFARFGPRYHLYAISADTDIAALCKQLAVDFPSQILLRVPDQEPDAKFFRACRLNPQVIYDCQDIVSRIENDLKTGSQSILSKRSQTTMRRNLRECSLRPANANDLEAIRVVLNHWRVSVSAANQGRVNIEKDLGTLDWLGQGDSLAHIGFRGEHPISYSFIVPISGYPDYAYLMATKSLNHKAQPGGYNEVSVWELYRSCQFCLAAGIKYLNVSGYASGHDSLKQFKSRFSNPELDFFVSDWEWIF